jgi:hypothetical protein
MVKEQHEMYHKQKTHSPVCQVAWDEASRDWISVSQNELEAWTLFANMTIPKICNYHSTIIIAKHRKTEVSIKKNY